MGQEAYLRFDNPEPILSGSRILCVPSIGDGKHRTTLAKRANLSLTVRFCSVQER
jgi:hypothetical protein